ncbi:MAG: hypothetical protein K8L91_01455 [Anaerolineae bacterium]|nr:hypothetical protein [Anaerolineae bacterium]
METGDCGDVAALVRVGIADPTAQVGGYQGEYLRRGWPCAIPHYKSGRARRPAPTKFTLSGIFLENRIIRWAKTAQFR